MSVLPGKRNAEGRWEGGGGGGVGIKRFKIFY